MLWILLTFAVLILGLIAAAVIQQLLQNRDDKRQLAGENPHA